MWVGLNESIRCIYRWPVATSDISALLPRSSVFVVGGRISGRSFHQQVRRSVLVPPGLDVAGRGWFRRFHVAVVADEWHWWRYSASPTVTASSSTATPAGSATAASTEPAPANYTAHLGALPTHGNYSSALLNNRYIITYLGRSPHWTDLHRNLHSSCRPRRNHVCKSRVFVGVIWCFLVR